MFSPFDDSKQDAKTPYVATAGEALGLDSLQGEHEADIVIVGGGITGCSAALHAAEAGQRVILLEGVTIGWGASSRNSGHLPPATKHEPEEIMRRYGPVFGPRIIEASGNGPRTVASLAERHGISCGIALNGIVTGAHTPAAIATLRRRVEQGQALNRPLEMLSAAEFSSLSGTRSYYGGMIDRNGGAINPLAYVRGLARAAARAGASLFEQTAATGLVHEDGSWTVSTAAAKVRAAKVFLCTNAHTDGLWPGLKQSVIPVRVVQFMTRPLSDNVRASILPGGRPMMDTRHVVNAVRLHADGRLHFSMGARMRVGTAPSSDLALARMHHIFPQLGRVEIEDWWAGWMGFNPANSWQLHTLGPGLFAALGCNGRGVVLATLYGRELARHATGVPESELTFPMTPLRRVRMHSFAGLGVSAVRRWHRLRDAYDLRRASGAEAAP